MAWTREEHAIIALDGVGDGFFRIARGSSGKMFVAEAQSLVLVRQNMRHFDLALRRGDGSMFKLDELRCTPSAQQKLWWGWVKGVVPVQTDRDRAVRWLETFGFNPREAASFIRNRKKQTSIEGAQFCAGIIFKKTSHPEVALFLRKENRVILLEALSATNPLGTYGLSGCASSSAPPRRIKWRQGRKAWSWWWGLFMFASNNSISPVTLNGIKEHFGKIGFRPNLIDLVFSPPFV